MKKWTLLIIIFMIIASMNAQTEKMKIAVMDFKAGVGVNKSEVDGLSDMLINTLYETRKFAIVERSQIDQVIKEQGFQLSGLTDEQLAEMGKILGVKSVLVGTVNVIAIEYNVDVRVVDVESGEIVTTAGTTKTANTTYREMMEKIGKQLAKNLEMDEPKPAIVAEKPKTDKTHFRNKGFVVRPEVGVNIPLFGIGYYNGRFLFSPSVEVAIGYQAGQHFYYGIIGGFGGKIRFYDPSGTVSPSSVYLPLKAEARWYLFDQINSFIMDFQTGIAWIEIDPYTTYTYFKPDVILKIGCGYAIRNFEGNLGFEVLTSNKAGGLTLDLAYRFGK